MATHDYVIANQNGANFRSDLNNVLQAIISNNSSATEPSTTSAYMWWADTANDKLKMRNGADSAWIDVMQISTGNPLFTGDLNLGDGDKINFGDSNDLEIYHDGANSWIKDTGTGDLYVDVGNDLHIRSVDGEELATFTQNGAVDLYYDNSEKLSTTSTGIDVTGSVVCDAIVPATQLSHRNLVINGNMRIAQRGTSFTPSGGTYTIDRWSYDPSAGLSWYTFIQNGDSLTPPTGFANYIAITSTGANTPTSSQFSVFRQPIEGLDTAQLGWGTSDAKDITISFWVRSSLTGTFAGSLRNSGANYTYPFTYSISSANTWEKKTVNIAGATSGTWLTTNGVGVVIGFNLGSGSNFSSTANTWTTNWSQTATGSVNISETNGAKLYLTGVQLEVGSVATPFEHRSYGEELARCQRYYYKWVTENQGGIGGVVVDNDDSAWNIIFPVTMRTSPTSTGLISGVTMTVGTYDGSNSSTGSFAEVFPSIRGCLAKYQHGTNYNNTTVGRPCKFNTDGDKLQFDAEL